MHRISIKKVMAGLAVLAGLCGLNRNCAEAAAVVAAYQKVYSMNFEVYRPDGLPSGWYATFDGYPVAQVSPNHWVYGEVGRQGVLVPTKVAVGAVVPMDVPQLARVAVSLWRSRMLETREFQHVLGYGVDNMAVLDDPMAYTPLAWKSGEAGFYIWMGDRWHRVVPAGGQSTAQAFAAKHPYIVRTLYEKDALWTRSDTQELADQARAWGCLWRGPISYVSRLGYPGDNTGYSTYSASSGSGGSVPGTETVPDGGQWDIGGDGTGTGGTGGGGWDVGGGGTGSGGGSGWDTGSPGGGSTPDPDDGDSSGETPGGGWDK